MRRHLPIIAVLGVALALRAWGISFGLPNVLTRPDEDAVMSIALRFFGRTLNPGFFDWPSLFMYAVAAGFVVYFNIGRLAGMFPTESSFVAAASISPTPLLLIARGLSAAAGVVTVATVHRVGVLLFDRTTGVVGALFLAVAALHVRDSHFGVTDVAATCLLAQSFLCAVRATRAGLRRDVILSALWAGLAASTKYNAGLVALPAVWAILSGQVPGLDGWHTRLRSTMAYGGVAAVAFLVGTPYALLDPGPFFASLAQIAAHLRDGHAGFAGSGWSVHLSSSLRYGMGGPMLGAGLAGLGLVCAHDWRKGVLFALFPVTYFVLIGSGQTAFARYIIPVVPFLCLAAAYATVWMTRWIAGRIGQPAMAQSLGWVLAVVIALPSAWSAIQTDTLLSRTDNRLLAAEWIRDRFATGARMHQSGGSSTGVRMQTADALAADRYRDVMFDEATGEFTNADQSLADAPELVVVPECPLAYCQVPDALRLVLARDYGLEQTFIALDTSLEGLAYDLDDAFFVPLAGFGAVTRPGPNLAMHVRRAVSR